MALDSTTPRNPYAAPTAAVADVVDAANARLAFFPVGRTKLALMSLATFGLYEVFWFYKNWKSAQRLDSTHVNVPLRVLFLPLTAYSLFQRIERHLEPTQIKISPPPGVLALSVFVLAGLTRLPDPYWLVALLGFLPLLPIQAAVNEHNRRIAPGADSNDGFSAWNIVGLVVGGTLFVASIAGLFIGDA